MTLVIAYICLAGFGASWYWYIIVLWIWVTKLVIRIGANANQAKNNQLVAFEVATANKLTALEATMNHGIEDLRRRLDGLKPPRAVGGPRRGDL
jgi:hypothetical protein